jgi:hypothetical protein
MQIESWAESSRATILCNLFDLALWVQMTCPLAPPRSALNTQKKHEVEMS